jgi:branched-chain amino acid transport system ATP-binding protein
MLKIAGLRAGYGPVEILKQVSLEVGAGRFVALLGANGAGKTTTLKAIAGFLPARAGTIELEGASLRGLSPAQIVRRGISLVSQERDLFHDMSVLDNLTLGAFTRSDAAAVRADLERMLDLFPVLRERRRQAAGGLSGGERQMLAIARALMAQPKLLLLDEPSLGLAPLVVREIFEVLRRINRDGMPILLVEQKVPLALSLASEAYVLEVGRVVFSGPARELEQIGAERFYLGRRREVHHGQA